MNWVPQGQSLFKLFWRFYIVLGIISIAIGLLLLYKTGLFFMPHQSEYGLAKKIGIFFIIFGGVRIVSAIFQLRKLGRLPKP